MTEHEQKRFLDQIARNHGHWAGKRNDGKEKCPYPEGTARFAEWHHSYDEARST